MKITAVSIILLIVLMVTVSCGPDSKKKPDIILIVPDALRAKQLPDYGYHNINTPRIDQLAKEGVLFKHCYVKIPGTLPSFSCLFSGLQFPSNGLMKKEKKMAQYLKENGYITLGVVSSRMLWSEEHQEKGGISNHFNHGFDQYLQDATLDRMPYHRENIPTTNDALAMLEKHKDSDKPIFLFVHYMDPHYPYHPSYDKEIEKIDVEVGRIIDKLKEIKRYDRSLVIFTSDHGESIGNAETDHGSPSGHGWFLYDEQVRVPLIFKFPGQTFAKSVEQIVRNYDIMPTILNYTGIEYDAGKLDGKSLMPAIKQDKDLGLVSYSIGSANRVMPEGSYSVTFSHKNNIYVYMKGKHTLQVRELYNITKDPLQKINLFRDKTYRPAAAKAHKLLQQFIKKDLEFKLKKVKKAVGQSKKATRVLKALGYLNADAPSATITIGNTLMRKNIKGIGQLQYTGIIRHPTWGHYPDSTVWRNLNDERYPIALTTDGKDGFYITGNLNRELFHYRNGTGFQPVNIENVQDLAFDNKNNRLLVVQGKKVNTLQSRETAAAFPKSPLNSVRGVYAGPAGNTYLIGEKKIVKIDAKGKTIKKYNVTVSSPSLFAVDIAGNIVAGQNGFVKKYDKNGRLICSFNPFGESRKIAALALDKNNLVWTAAEHSVMLKVFDPEGKKIAELKYNYSKNNRWKPAPIKQLYIFRDKLYIIDNFEGILVYSISS